MSAVPRSSTTGNHCSTDFRVEVNTSKLGDASACTASMLEARVREASTCEVRNGEGNRLGRSAHCDTEPAGRRGTWA